MHHLNDLSNITVIVNVILLGHAAHYIHKAVPEYHYQRIIKIQQLSCS